MQIRQQMIYFGFLFKRKHFYPTEICNAIMGLVSIYQTPVFSFTSQSTPNICSFLIQIVLIFHRSHTKEIPSEDKKAYQ